MRLVSSLIIIRMAQWVQRESGRAGRLVSNDLGVLPAVATTYGGVSKKFVIESVRNDRQIFRNNNSMLFHAIGEYTSAFKSHRLKLRKRNVLVYCF